MQPTSITPSGFNLAVRAYRQDAMEEIHENLTYLIQRRQRMHEEATWRTLVPIERRIDAQLGALVAYTYHGIALPEARTPSAQAIQLAAMVRTPYGWRHNPFLTARNASLPVCAITILNHTPVRNRARVLRALRPIPELRRLNHRCNRAWRRDESGESGAHSVKSHVARLLTGRTTGEERRESLSAVAAATGKQEKLLDGLFVRHLLPILTQIRHDATAS